MLHRICEVSPLPEFRLHVLFEGEEPLTVDLGALLASGGVWDSLTAPERFAQVRLGEGGRFLEWPGEIDYCADALWLETHAHSSP